MDAVERQWQLPSRLGAGVMRRLLLLVALVLVATACVADERDGGHLRGRVDPAAGHDGHDRRVRPPARSRPRPPPRPRTTTARLPELLGLGVELLADGFDQPVNVAAHGSDIYVAEREGVIKVVSDGVVSVHADLSDQIGSSSIEQGLLGLAFDGDDLYLYWTDPQGDSVLARFAGGATGFDGDGQETLLTVDQPAETPQCRPHRHRRRVSLSVARRRRLRGSDRPGHHQPGSAPSCASTSTVTPFPATTATPSGSTGFATPGDTRSTTRPTARPRCTIGDVGQEQFEEINVNQPGRWWRHQLRLDRDGG